MATSQHGTTEPRTATEAEPRTPERAESTPSRRTGVSARPRRVLDRFNLRWVFMFFLFYYLITLAMTLFEVDAFQKLVAQLGASSEEQGTIAGNARQREILQAVRSTSLRSRGYISPITEQLYLQVAAKIDPLRVAIDALEDIGAGSSFKLREDETYKRAQHDAFRELTGRIGRAADDVQQTLALSICEEWDSRIPDKECIEVPSKVLAVNLGKLQTQLAELRGYIADESQNTAGWEDRAAEKRIETETQIIGVTTELAQLAKDLEDPKGLKKVEAARGNTTTKDRGFWFAQVICPEEDSADVKCSKLSSKVLAVDPMALQELLAELRGYIEGKNQRTAALKKPATERRPNTETQILGVVEDLQKLGTDLEELHEITQSNGESADKIVTKALHSLKGIDPEDVMVLKSASYPAAMTDGEGRDTGNGESTGDDRATKLTPISVRLRPGKSNDQVVWLREILSLYGIKKKPQLYKVQFPKGDDKKLLDGNLQKILEQFQTDNGLTGKAVDGDVGRTTRPLLNDFVTKCNQDPECIKHLKRAKNGGSIAGEIVRLRGALGGIADLIRPYVPGLGDIPDLTKQLSNIEVASRRLAHLDVTIEKNPFAGATPEKPLDEARRIYRAETQALASAIEQMRTTLKGASTVLPIADAIGEQDPLAHKKATAILREYEALARYQEILTPLAFLELPTPQCEPLRWSTLPTSRTAFGIACKAGYLITVPWNWIANIGFSARFLSTMTRQGLDMMVILVMGAMGSLIYLIRYLLSQTLLGKEEGSPVWRPMRWYVFRPLFGIVVAFAVYLLYKTGQLALGGGNVNVLASDVNLPMLSIFALFSGLLSWHTLEMVENKGRKWLSAQHRENLWASGLNPALRSAGKTTNDCANQVGRTPTQVDRWIAGRDKVNPEMQDRITTWLGRDRAEIFSDTNPQDIKEDTLRWATGLKGALKANKAGIDVPRLAQMIEQDVTTVHAWVELKRQVDQEMQFLIADKLGESREKLFTVERPDAEYWAIGLRTALHKGSSPYSTADELARAIGSTQQNIRRYMELKASVPQPVQNLIVEALALDRQTLFSPNLPLDADFRWAAKLRDCIRKSNLKNAGELAEKIDTETAWVRAWMEQEVCGEEDPPYCGQVAPATQPRLVEVLGCASDALFRSERAVGDFKWVVMPRVGDLIEARGGVGELASRLDLDVSRIERWITGGEPVAPETQLALLADLGLPIEEEANLFTSRPPMDPEHPEGTWWATGLRAAVREHPGYRTLGRLAAELQVPVEALFDHVEMLAPVPQDLRDRITRLLGPTSASNGALFSTRAPDWSEFLWAPKLRAALDQAEMDPSELALELDVDLGRVRDWMEMDKSGAGTQWARDKVKRGQICPTTCNAIVKALGGKLSREQLFSADRPERGELWAVKPTFRIAADAFDGKLAGFAEQIDADPARVERWAEQDEPVGPDAQARILDVFGLKPEEAGQLFALQKKVEDAQG